MLCIRIESKLKGARKMHVIQFSIDRPDMVNQYLIDLQAAGGIVFSHSVSEFTAPPVFKY